CLQSYNLFLIWLAFCVHSYKETFTILHYFFTNFSHSSIIFFIIVIIEYYYLIQDFYFFFYLTLFICSSIILYMFLIMTLHSHNKCSCSAHTEQFISKSSYIDRFISVNDCDFNVESLIENLKNVIMKKLSILCVTESSVFFSAFSVSFSAALSQSSISASVSDSPASATSISVTSTPATSALTTAFVTSSLCFKKMLCRLSELHFSRITSSLNSVKI
ncbi:hypothetical protein BDBG_16799, partial [Blastomyces gilchristii SLH14081]